MRKQLLRLGILCLFVLLACAAKAQNVVATWDFQNRIPASLADVTIQGSTGEVASDVEGVSLFVDATNGKFAVRSSDVQINAGTIIHVPVNNARNVIAVTTYPSYHDFTIGGTKVNADYTEYTATSTEAAQGYVEIIATGSIYLYKITATFISDTGIQEKEIYSTSFTEWPEFDMKSTEAHSHEVTTKYSREKITFTLKGAGAYPNKTQDKFTNLEDKGLGYIELAKYEDELNKQFEPYVETSKIGSLTKIVLTQAATGGNRGIKLMVKGEDDTDWNVLHNKSIADSKGETLTFTFDEKKNCVIRIENFTLNQNSYITDLALYGNVDMSKYPSLGSFIYNGTTYEAVDIFTETSENVQEATIELFNDVELPSETNPITSITCDNGEVDGEVTYTEQTDGSVLVTINVSANGETVAYKATFKHKPYYTLTYYNTDGQVISNDQPAEKDRPIGKFTKGEADVKIPDGQAFRGWFMSADGGEKYTTDYIVTSDINLYAIATEIETASTTARYTFDLTDEFFYDEDHEAFEAEGNGTQFHDGTHGWVLKPTGKIKLLVGGHAYISLRMCNQGSNRTFTMTDENNNEIETFDGKASTDGEPYTVEYNGEAGWLTLTTTNADAYIHKIIIANVEDGEPVATNEEGYYVVKAGDGTHLMNTLDVVNSLPADQGRAYIFLPDGTYDLGNEVLTPISRDNVSIIGQSMDKTIIVNEAPVEGIGVSATFLITGTGTYMQDLTLKNAYDYYGIAGSAGRAVVIEDKGNRTICKNVRMLSYQDTYYSHISDGQLYFENSDIHGTVDFICGGGDVFFNECTLTVEKRSKDGSGECTITAPTTTTEFGYVFNNCTIDCLAEEFNFGRGWQNKPRSVYINTTLLQPERLVSTRWNPEGINNTAPVLFGEYNTKDATGNNITPTDNFVNFVGATEKMNTILTAEQAEGYTLDKVFTDWTPGESAKQKELGLLKADGTSLTWDAVDGATAYAVFHNGEFVSMTATPSYTINEGSADEYTVRAANECGGFGKAASTTYTSGIDNVGAESGNVVSTAYYSVQGSRVSESYTGIVIKVETFDNGKTKTTKMVK